MGDAVLEEKILVTQISPGSQDSFYKMILLTLLKI